MAAVNMIGQITFGIGTWRAGVFPKGAAASIAVGGLLFNLPPAAVPMLVLALGGLLWSVGALVLGASLIRRKE